MEILTQTNQYDVSDETASNGDMVNVTTPETPSTPPMPATNTPNLGNTTPNTSFANLEETATQGVCLDCPLENFAGADVEVPIGPITPDLGGGLLQSVLDTVIGLIDDLIDGSEEGQETTNTCPTTTGYLHTAAFASTVTQGTNTIVNADNFRNAAGAIISEFNCNTGKILQGDTVSVTGPVETRTYIKADGSEGTSTYYPVSITKCDTNLPGNPGYDASKPCYDCESANPLTAMGSLQNTPAGIANPEDKNGGHFGWNRDKRETINPASGDNYHKFHSGYDIPAQIGTPVYAAHSGTVDALIDSHPNDVSQWTDEEGKFDYEDYKDWRRNQTPSLPTNAGGNKIKIGWTENGTYSSHNYEHLQQGTLQVNANDYVTKGQLLGYSGITGNAQTDDNGGPHLHFAKYNATGAVNPDDDLKVNYNEQGHDNDPCDDN